MLLSKKYDLVDCASTECGVEMFTCFLNQKNVNPIILGGNRKVVVANYQILRTNSSGKFYTWMAYITHCKGFICPIPIRLE